MIKEHPENLHQGIKCNLTNEEIKGPRYYGRPPHEKGKNPLNYSEKAMF
jgi:hypothetical protein